MSLSAQGWTACSYLHIYCLWSNIRSNDANSLILLVMFEIHNSSAVFRSVYNTILKPINTEPWNISFNLVAALRSCLTIIIVHDVPFLYCHINTLPPR